jgi:hypothetical protein
MTKKSATNTDRKSHFYFLKSKRIRLLNMKCLYFIFSVQKKSTAIQDQSSFSNFLKSVDGKTAFLIFFRTTKV